MKQTGYLQWAIENTNTVWWHDSAEPSELNRGIERGAVGATTNPFLSHLALSLNKDAWAEEVNKVLSAQPEPERKAVQLMGIVITHAANIPHSVSTFFMLRLELFCSVRYHYTHKLFGFSFRLWLPRKHLIHLLGPSIFIKG